LSADTIAVVVALVAMLAMHFFRGPNRQTDDVREEIKAVKAENVELGRRIDTLSTRVSGEHQALDRRLSSEHYTRTEIREMLREIKEQVGLLQGVVAEIKTAVALMTGAKNGGRNGH
jgi:hypothetical protein